MAGFRIKINKTKQYRGFIIERHYGETNEKQTAVTYPDSQT